MFPGVLSDLLPNEHQAEVDRLRLFRDEYELLRDLYIQSFETCHKALRWVVGSANASDSADPNVFTPVAGMKPEVSARPPRDLDAFSKLVSRSSSRLGRFEGFLSLRVRQSLLASMAAVGKPM